MVLEKTPRRYQTIIIGAGPAGLIAGQHLEDVLILEQKKEIGRVFDFLKNKGVNLEIKDK